MPLPVVAVVGRPNVGKSTLFNKLIGKRLSIVEDTPGVTRDRIYSKCEWRGREFMVVDTGGIEPKTDDVILSQMKRQAELAIERADVIVLVTDVRCGVTASDYDVATMLQKSGKPVVLAVNKCDVIGDTPPEVYEFYNLGLGDPFPISSAHGHGTGDLLDEVFTHFPENESDDYEYFVAGNILTITPKTDTKLFEVDAFNTYKILLSFNSLTKKLISSKYSLYR